MPMGIKPECCQCETQIADIWRKEPNGLLCNVCYERNKEEERQDLVKKQEEEKEQPKTEPPEKPKPARIVLRKSTRMTRNYKTRGNPYALPKPTLGRSKGRKVFVRKANVRAPVETRTWFRANRAYLLNGYLRVGDVVSILGTDGVTYYAQLRGFVTDLYGEKKAVITWLLPTKDHKPGVFKLENFFLGPEEDTPRRLSEMEFELRLPDNDKRYNRPPFFRDSLENFIQEPLSCI